MKQKATNQANATFAKQNQANQAVNVNVTANDSNKTLDGWSRCLSCGEIYKTYQGGAEIIHICLLEKVGTYKDTYLENIDQVIDAQDRYTNLLNRHNEFVSRVTERFASMQSLFGRILKDKVNKDD